MGVSLASIKQAFTSLPNERTPSTQDWEKLSTNWRDDLNARIAYMKKLRDSLTSCIGCGCLSMKHCPIYNEDDKLGSDGVGAVILER